MKNTYLWVLVAVVVVGAFFFFGRQGQGPSINLEGSPTESPSSSPRPASNIQATPQFQESQIQTYSEYVAQYEGRRIQFDESCQARPAEVTFKNGTSIMLDNRSAQARNITVGSVTYSLPGYGYRIITLSSGVLPVNLSISCGASPNIGTILLQAVILQE